MSSLKQASLMLLTLSEKQNETNPLSLLNAKSPTKVVDGSKDMDKALDSCGHISASSPCTCPVLDDTIADYGLVHDTSYSGCSCMVAHLSYGIELKQLENACNASWHCLNCWCLNIPAHTVFNVCVMLSVMTLAMQFSMHLDLTMVAT